MLKLKKEIDILNKHSIFIHKSRGRKIIFDPQTVEQKHYAKYKALGFNIFRCEECGFDTCFGDCNLPEEVFDLFQDTFKEEKESEKGEILAGETNLEEETLTKIEKQVKAYTQGEPSPNKKGRKKKEVKDEQA